jgi:hypothetical protein
MTSNVATNLPSSTTPPPAPRASTPKFVTAIVGALSIVTLLAMSYKTAVEALAAAKDATKKALSAEPVSEASYNELSKTISELSDQLKATQTDVRTLAEYIQTHPPAALPGATGNAGARPSPTPPASASAASPPPASSASLPVVLARLKAVENRPALKPPTFDEVRDKARVPTRE